MLITNHFLRVSLAIGFFPVLLALTLVVGSRAPNNKVVASPKGGELALQQAGDKDETSEWAQCETYCDPYKPGTSVAEVRWRVSEGSLSTSELTARTSTEVLEVSVYKDGFERNLYANVSTSAGRHTFALTNIPPSQKRLPGLQRLTLVDLNTSPAETKKGFRMIAADPAGRGGGWAVAKVEGLEPGLVYFWRVKNQESSVAPGGARVVSCQAATCPVDSMRRPLSSRRARRRR